MFSQTNEYALRAIVHLANHAPELQTTEQIARVTMVPTAYLSKVMQLLRKAEIVKTQRGVGGGMTLTKSPEELTILEVIDAVDPIKRIESCPLKLKAHGKNLCPLHKRLDEASAAMRETFQQSTLADILNEPNPSVPLCPFPRQLDGKLKAEQV